MSETEDIDTELYIPKLEPHPFANMFPRMMPEQFDTLRQNITIHGLAHPIVLYQRKILDGVNRYNACVQEQVSIRTIEFEGNDMEAFHFVINSNLHRRELTESQRALCVFDVHQTQGKMRINDPSFTQETLASKFNVSRRLVSYAFALMRSGNEELIQAVRTGKIPVHIAATLLSAGDDKQTAAIADPDNAPKIAREVKRVERDTKIGNKIAEANVAKPQKSYGVIYIDPPWKFEAYSEETGNGKAADNHYPTMETNAILDLEIPAAEDCICFMWVTVPFLAKGIEILDHWGFEYKSAWFWDKKAPGTGYWFRNQVEMILVGAKGKISAPVQGEQPPQLISEAKTTHSTKPDAFANHIARLYPTLPKVEMFARKARAGWDIWGNEVGFREDQPPPDFVQEKIDEATNNPLAGGMRGRTEENVMRQDSDDEPVTKVTRKRNK